MFLSMVYLLSEPYSRKAYWRDIIKISNRTNSIDNFEPIRLGQNVVAVISLVRYPADC